MRRYGLLLDYLFDERPSYRKNAAQELGELGDDRAVPVLLKVLDDKDREVRLTVAEALQKLGERKGEKVLIEELARDLLGDDPEKSKKAAEDLERLRNVDGVSLLLDTIDRQNPSEIKVAEALARAGVPKGVKDLIKHLYSPIRRMSERATEALGKIQDPFVVDVLIDSMNDQRINGLLRKILYKIKMNAVPALLRGLMNQDQGVRGQAAHVLCKMTKRAREKEAYAAKCYDEAYKVLMEAFNSDDEQIAQDAAAAMGVILDPRALEPMRATAKDPDRFEGLRIQVAHTLTKMEDPVGVEVLLEFLGGEDDELCRNAEHALEYTFVRDRSCKSVACIDNLVSGMVHEKVWYKVRDILEDIGPDAIPSLVKAFKDEKKKLRFHCLVTYNHIGIIDTELMKRTFEEEEDRECRYPIATALVKSLCKENIPKLEKLKEEATDDIIKEVAGNAIEHLERKLGLFRKEFIEKGRIGYHFWEITQIGGPKARDLLTHALQNSEHVEEVWDSAEHLGEMGDVEALPALEEAIIKRGGLSLKKTTADGGTEEVFVRDPIEKAIRTLRGE